MILLPYTRLHPATARLANVYAPGHVRIRLSPGDDTAYWRLLAETWSEPGDLMVVEHDIGLRPGVVDGLAACREPWCGHPYRIHRLIAVCLGCTRFTAGLKATEPDLLDAVGRIDNDDGPPAKHWRRLDVRLADELHRRGYQVHEHQPQVAHYHRYPT